MPNEFVAPNQRIGGHWNGRAGTLLMLEPGSRICLSGARIDCIVEVNMADKPQADNRTPLTAWPSSSPFVSYSPALRLH